MTESIAGGRRPYIKPFVRNLDASDTEGKTYHVNETVTGTPSPGPAGPS